MTTAQAIHAEQLLQAAAMNFSEPPPPDQCVFRFNFKRVGDLGDFILLTGKKSDGKTKVESAGIASALTRQEVFKLNIKLPDHKRRVVHFDTEQGKGSWYKQMQLIKKLADLDTLPDFFNSYRCRSIAPGHILLMVEFYLSKNPDTGIVWIDGMLDTVESMNDEKAANALKNRLQRISEEHNTLLVGIMHRGFSADKAMGHIGSYLERGAQTVLKVSRQKKDGIEFFTIGTEYIRDDAAPDDVAFYYNPRTNALELFELATPETEIGSREIRKTAKNSPAQFDILEHTRRCGQIFDSTGTLLQWDVLKREIQMAYNCTRNEAGGEFYQYLLSNGLIYKTDAGYTNQKVVRLFIEK